MLCTQNTQQAEVGIDRKVQSKETFQRKNYKDFDQTLQIRDILAGFFPPIRMKIPFSCQSFFNKAEKQNTLKQEVLLIFGYSTKQVL